jgi:hypothetical protein
LILQKGGQGTFQFKRVRKITPEILARQDTFIQYRAANFNSDPWIFLSPETELVFNKLHSQQSTPLNALAEICVGLQTSADKVYIFEPERETPDSYLFTRNAKELKRIYAYLLFMTFLSIHLIQ